MSHELDGGDGCRGRFRLGLQGKAPASRDDVRRALGGLYGTGGGCRNPLRRVSYDYCEKRLPTQLVNTITTDANGTVASRNGPLGTSGCNLTRRHAHDGKITVGRSIRPGVTILNPHTGKLDRQIPRNSSNRGWFPDPHLVTATRASGTMCQPRGTKVWQGCVDQRRMSGDQPARHLRRSHQR